MVIRLFIKLILGLALVSAQASHAYVVGGEEVNNYPYYSFEGAAATGIGQAVIKEFAKHKKIQIDFKLYPVERLFRAFLKDDSDLDFKFPDNPHWRKDLKKGMEKNISYSLPIALYIDGTMVLSENKDAPPSEIKKLALLRGFTPYSYLSLVKKGKVTLVKENSMESVIRHVFEGTADGAYLNVEVAKYVMKQAFSDRAPLVFNPKMLHDKGGYLVSTTKHPSLINDLNQFLKSTDIRNQILEKFGVPKQF